MTVALNQMNEMVPNITVYYEVHVLGFKVNSGQGGQAWWIH
jgi:hypothetical protein